MSQLEIIHLRMAGHTSDRLLQQIRRRVDPPVGARVRIYRQAVVGGDIAVHLQLPSGDHAGQPTDLGLRLAAALRAHGMVEHTVWLEARNSTGVTD